MAGPGSARPSSRPGGASRHRTLQGPVGLLVSGRTAGAPRQPQATDVSAGLVAGSAGPTVVMGEVIGGPPRPRVTNEGRGSSLSRHFRGALAGSLARAIHTAAAARGRGVVVFGGVRRLLASAPPRFGPTGRVSAPGATSLASWARFHSRAVIGG